MAYVTITGQLRLHDRSTIPAGVVPELRFRPNRANELVGLMTDQSVKAEFYNVSTGAFSVRLESVPGIEYTPHARWLLSADDVDAKGYCEWPAFYPGPGGDISALSPFAGIAGILAGFGRPPASLSNVFYLDITGPQIVVYGPASSRIGGA